MTRSPLERAEPILTIEERLRSYNLTECYQPDDWIWKKKRKENPCMSVCEVLIVESNLLDFPTIVWAK